MDMALLSSNANQLRHALDLCAPYRSLLIVLLSLSSILLTNTEAALHTLADSVDTQDRSGIAGAVVQS